MEATAFLSRPRRHVPSEAPAMHGALLCAGQDVRIALGALAGMQGTLVKRCTDGRWVVQLANVAAGVLLCIDADHLESC